MPLPWGCLLARRLQRADKAAAVAAVVDVVPVLAQVLERALRQPVERLRQELARLPQQAVAAGAVVVEVPVPLLNRLLDVRMAR